jgi:predicted DNA binding CopG/RHH family protein
MKKEVFMRDNKEKNMDQLLDQSDFTDAIKNSTSLDLSKKRGRPQIGEKISITIPPDLIEDLKVAASKRHIGYQTMLRIILAENIEKY